MTEIPKTAVCPACGGYAEVPRCTRCEAWVIKLPAAAKVMNSNDRGNHWKRHKLTSAWRATAGWTARGLKLPTFQRAHVLVDWNASETRRRDPGNAYPTTKAALDGFVDAGVFLDDDHKHVIGPDIRLGPPCKPSTLTIAIVPKVES